MLLLRSSAKAGIYLPEQVLEQAIKYEFIELIAEIARHLRTQTARSPTDQKQHQQYVALPLLEARKNTNRSMLRSIAMQKLACLIQLRIFEGEAGEKVAEYCLSLKTDATLSWFRTLEQYFYYRTYQRKYTEALYIFEKATKHAHFAQLEGSFKDNWLLLGGYLHLLAALGRLDSKQVESIVGPYRYGRLVNEVETVDKDREGMNIPLLFLPILFGLAQGNYAGYGGRSEEALEKCRQCCLNNPVNQRSAAFMNMLMALDKKAFDPVSAKRRIKKGLDTLQQEQPQVIGQSFAIEIIPYEDLWTMLQEKLSYGRAKENRDVGQRPGFLIEIT